MARRSNQQVKCVNKDHRHDTEVNGFDVRMVCPYCGNAMHWDEVLVEYMHDRSGVSCMVINRNTEPHQDCKADRTRVRVMRRRK